MNEGPQLIIIPLFLQAISCKTTLFTYTLQNSTKWVAPFLEQPIIIM
jgi:hypothetical protein